MTGSPEYIAYHSMLQRCYNPKDAFYHRYGGRDIDVCARWRESFVNFLADMGLRGGDKLSIDRENNSKGYWCGKPTCPDCGPNGRVLNCRWADGITQNGNRENNKVFTFDGKTMCVEAWSREPGPRALGIKANVLYSRLVLMKWDIERALTTPVAAYRRKPKKGGAA